MFAWASLGVVLISTFTFVLGTFPEFQKEADTGQPPPYPEAVMVMDIVGSTVDEINNQNRNPDRVFSFEFSNRYSSICPHLTFTGVLFALISDLYSSSACRSFIILNE